ncbi:hypothetical protein H4582DRAFT_659589 [Lactarius indigo]|nr:hypothetical protein H4582DRAFT_659589 [Lactarius indigo]
MLVSTPVQSLLLWRCYYILKRNVYIIMPLILLLLGTVALGIFDTIWLLMRTYGWGRSSHSHPFWSLLMYSASSSVLDIVLSCILFFYLNQSRKRVYADQAVQVRVVVPVSAVSRVLLKVFLSKWISRLIIIVWQSAIPPTVCVIGFFLTYILSHRLHPGQKQMWYPTLHAVIGKLYVLSHFYNINSLTFFVGEQEQPSTRVSALTVPALDVTSSAYNTLEEHTLELYSNSIECTDERSDRHCGSN